MPLLVIRASSPNHDGHDDCSLKNDDDSNNSIDDDHYRQENYVLPLHDIEDGKDHADDKENGDNNANCPSGIGLDRRCGNDVPGEEQLLGQSSSLKFLFENSDNFAEI